MTAKKSAKKKGVVIKKNSKFSKNNYWIISTCVLAIALIVVLVNGNISGATISSKAAGQKIIDFAKSQGADAALISVGDDGSLYEVVISVQGQEIPVYITKDGKSLIPQTVSLDEKTQTATQTPAQSTPTPKNIPKSDKPVVEAFVMSHCPYGTQIEKGLLPVMRLLGDKIDAQIKFVYYAMHPSAGEVEEQLNQHCIQSEQSDKYLNYLECFLEAGEGDECIETVGIDKTALASCVERTDKEFNVMTNLEDQSLWLSGRFPKFDIHKNDNEKYQIGGSPTLVINEKVVQAGRDSNSLLASICEAFNEVPEECSTEFEAVTPSPGFGFSTTDTTNNAMCG